MTAATGTSSRPAVGVGTRAAAAGGPTSTIMASASPLPASSARQSRNASALTAAVVSTGPLTEAPDGRMSRRRPWLAGLVVATVRPASVQASVASTPAPPALDTTHTRLPAGTAGQADRADP